MGSEVEVAIDGTNNKVAGRDFYNVNQYTSRPLTKDERVELNRKVQAMAELMKEPAWEVWRLVHRVVGVDSIDQMHLEHLGPIEVVFDLHEKVKDLEQKLHFSGIELEQEFNKWEDERLSLHATIQRLQVESICFKPNEFVIDPATEVTDSEKQETFSNMLRTYPEYCVLFIGVGVFVGSIFF